MRLKRVISAALAVSMAVSMMPATAVSAFAEGTSTNTAVTTTTVNENAPTSGDCGVESHEEVKWAYDESTKVLTISGNGPMADYNGIKADADVGTENDLRPWKPYLNQITEVHIEEGVTAIGNSAFRGMKALKKANIPASIQHLGDYIFRADSELTEVEWAPNFMAHELQDNDTKGTNGETHIGTYVPTSMFDFCSKLGDGKELTKWLPSSFTGVGCAAFRGTKFTVDFDNWSNLKYIGARAFEQMPYLESFTLTDGIQIGLRGTDSNAFNGSGLKKLIVNTEKVPRSFANGCTELTDITLGSAVKKIQPFAFYSTAITTLDVPEGISNIGDCAFYACKNLNKLTFRGKVTLGEKVFTACGIKELDILDGAEVICAAGDPFRGSGNDPAVTTINAVELKGALKSGKENQTDRNLWHDIFSKNTEITTVNVCGQNLQYVRPSVFPSMETLNVTGGDAHFPAENTYAFSGNNTLKQVNIDVDTYTEDEYKDQDGNSAVVASFRNAQALETFAVRANNVKLGNRTFCECANLKKIDFTGCDEIHYMNGCLGSSTSGQPLNPNVCIYVNDESANPRATNNDSGLNKNVGIVFVVDGGIVDMNKTGFDSVTKAGCTAKWYEDANYQTETEDSTPQKGETYYAKWTKNKYTVTLDNNGHGKKPVAIPPVEYGEPVTDLPELSDSTNEWVFDGWYMDENFATKYDSQAITGNTTLYAKWHEYQNTSLTAKVSKSNYLVNTPADVNVTVTPGDDIKDLKQNVNNIKISLTYDDDVTSVMLNGEVLDKKEYTISELMPLMGQNRKLDVTYGKAGTHTFGIALKNGDKIVSECSTDIVVAEEAAELTPATELYTLTVKNADVTIKNGDEEIKAEKNDKGELIAKVPEKADVTVTYTSQSDAVAFDQWTITTDETLDVDVKNNPLKFQMPDGGVTIEAMTKDASIEEDEPNILGTAAVVGTAAAGTAILAWQGYQLGTELYLKTALPAGTAIPTNRAELALLVWNHAGKPAPAAVLPADATDTQKAIAWAVENDLLKAAKDNGETYVDTDSVSRVEVIRVWNKAQEK